MYTKEQIEKAVKTLNYVWFDSNTDYDVNIVGVRNSETKDKVTNLFDDIITVSYKINGVWQFKSWANTTDPGITGVMEFENPGGVAILVPGQYRGSHQIGLHKGQYEALVQVKPLKVWRDKDKDMIYDHDVTTEGIYGINIHHAGADSSIINNWSYGCQVFKRLADFNEFMVICRKARDIHGNHFTYSLITQNDVK